MIRDFLQGKPFRHPLHPLLVHAPIGLFSLSFVLDIVSHLFPMEGFYEGSFYCLIAGLATGVLAAIPGLADYTDIRRDHPAKQKARWHMGLNFAMIAVFGVDAWIRHRDLFPLKTPALPFALSLLGIFLLSVSGYIGGTMVYEDGIAVGRHRRRAATPDKTIRIALPPQKAADMNEPLLVPVGDAESLREGESWRADLDGTIIAIARVDGEVHAFQEFCSHRFGPLSEGELRAGRVQCPWHGSCFDLRTGKVLGGPARVDLKIYPVRIREGKICIEFRAISSPVPSSPKSFRNA
jgi:uncharacterized membrane protein/nitrite reductase/ring-hydroxylating ferredoxin subunit